MDGIDQRRRWLASGLSFLGCGIVFLAIGYSAKPSFIGVGFAVIGLSFSYFARVWKC